MDEDDYNTGTPTRSRGLDKTGRAVVGVRLFPVEGGVEKEEGDWVRGLVNAKEGYRRAGVAG